MHNDETNRYHKVTGVSRYCIEVRRVVDLPVEPGTLAPAWWQSIAEFDSKDEAIAAVRVMVQHGAEHHDVRVVDTVAYLAALTYFDSADI